MLRLALALVILLALPASASAAIDLASVGAPRARGGETSAAALPGDGRMAACQSGAVASVRNRATGRTQRLGCGFEPVLDNSGRLVAYTKGTRVRIRDRRTGATRSVPTG